MAHRNTYLNQGELVSSNLLTKFCLLVLVFTDFGFAADYDSSAESIRRYIALYEQQHPNAAKQIRFNVPRTLGFKILASEPSTNDNQNVPKTPEDVYGPYDSWLAKTQQPQKGNYQPSDRFSWFQGAGQPEVIANDEDILEVPSRPIGVQVFPPKEDISNPNEENGYFTTNQDSNQPVLTNEPHKKSEESSNRDRATHFTPPGLRDIPLSQSRVGQDVTNKKNNPLGDIYFVVIVAGCSTVAIFGVIAAGFCFYRFQKNNKAAAEVDYPAYGVTGPNKEHTTSPSGDRRLAQSAQMYHYQHQKQQMIAVEKATTVRNTSASDVDSEEENEEGDYTVYECPGLAPTGEMEVKNPLFHDDSTPMSPPVSAKENVKKT